MDINIIAKLLLISAITVLLLIKKENSQVEHLPQQTWSIIELLPVYWVFIFISLIWLYLNKFYPAGRFVIFSSFISTLLSGSILFFTAKIILGKRKIFSLKVIGGKRSDLNWLLLLIVIQYSILSVFLFDKIAASHFISILWMLGYFSITLVFGPVIESVFFLGLMLIPTSRKVGLIGSVVLVSLLWALLHFHQNLSQVAINFILFGLLSCYLYIKSKKIIVPVLVHSSLNFLVLMRDLNIDL